MKVEAGDMKVGVVIPTFNEEKALPGVLAAIPEWVSAVYVVDDGSSDDSAEAARAVGDTRVRVIVHPKNRGLGAAMRTGYAAALEGRCEVIVKLDADGQMDPAELDRLVAPIAMGLAEYVKGNRFRYASRLGGMPVNRRFGNVMLSFLTKLASGYWHVFDSQCGYTAVLAHTLEAAGMSGIPDDYFFENEMLIRLSGVGARVVDVPVSVTYGDEISDVRISRVIASFPTRLALRWFRRIFRQHLLYDFGAAGALGVIGVPLVLFGCVFGLYHWVLSIATGRLASTGTVMVAVLPIMLGVQMLTQALLIEVNQSPGAAETREVERMLSRASRRASGDPGGGEDVRDAV